MAAERTTIVIVSWNTRVLLEACLLSLLADRPAARIVVVDNASSDGTLEALAPRFPQVRWVPAGGNVGFARANNLGFAGLDTEFVWCLNPDTEVRPGALEALEAWLDAHPQAGAVGASLVNPDGSPQACSFAFPTPTSTLVEALRLPRPVARWRDRIFRLRPREQAGRTDWVLGAALMLRASVLAEVGGFREDAFLYGEEVELCRRVVGAGWEVHRVPDAVVMHHGGAATAQVPEHTRLALYESRGRELGRELGRIARVAFLVGALAVSCWNEVYGFLRPDGAAGRTFPLRLFAAWWRGLRAPPAAPPPVTPVWPAAPLTPARLSAVVIVRNEAHRLANCLERLLNTGLVSELVVVDDQSTDGTVEVARRFTPHVIVHPHVGENWDLNKNVGMAQATGEWILLIDADEHLAPGGLDELRRFLAAGSPLAGCWLPRQEWWFGAWARHATAGARVLRLVRRGAARFEGERLHAHPRIAGPVGQLQAPLVHEAYASVSEYVAKTRLYTDHEAHVLYTSGARVGLGAVPLAFARHLWHRGWRLQGWRDGWTGLVYCVVTALYPTRQAWMLWRLGRRERT